MTRRRLPYALAAVVAAVAAVLRPHPPHIRARPSLPTRALPHAELGSTRWVVRRSMVHGLRTVDHATPATPTTTPEPPPSTTTAAPESLEQQVIDGPTFSCIRQVESGDNYAWGYDPWGTGDGGGAYQFEPGTYAQGAEWAGISPQDHSRTAQDAVAFAIWRHVGYSPWTDGCE